MSESLVLLGMMLAAVSGVPGLLLSRVKKVPGTFLYSKRLLAPFSTQSISVVLAVAGSVLGLGGVIVFWATGLSQEIRWDWPIPGAEWHVGIDGLSAFFLAPIFLVSMLGNIYGLDYWKQAEHPQNGTKLRFFYGVVTASMALLVLARNSLLFLFGWEIMALSAFFLVTTEDHDKEVVATGWLYLVATHVATLSLFALFALLHRLNDSFALVRVPENSLTSGTALAIFLLALVGFGLKAGVMPLHIWLPSSHALAPSHVSAIMSGVIIKMGIYGLVRILSLLPQPPWQWGATLLGFGALSGVLGVAFAIGQHDLKRLLAYHSIENIGIIVMGIGLALVGKSLDRVEWIVLGLGGGLLHVWNHALFKALLFLSAGSVIRAVHTRELDRLGGLAKRMPWTALSFLVGAVAICGLPPLNGFVSEWLIYLGLFSALGLDGGPSFLGAVLAAPALALIGGLAAACFVKVYGVVFLGTARSEHAEGAQESGQRMLGPMGVLAACCLLIGLAPLLVAPILDQAIVAWAPELRGIAPALATLAPLGWISVMGLLLVASLAIGAWMLMRRLRGSEVRAAVTWGCAYVAPTPRMQYTASSFAQMLVGLFAWALRPRTRRPKELSLFPKPAHFHSEVPETVLDEAILPSLRFGAGALAWFRVLHQGNIQTYLLYLFLTLLALLLWRT